VELEKLKKLKKLKKAGSFEVFINFAPNKPKET
jgi:hypothetical protein